MTVIEGDIRTTPYLEKQVHSQYLGTVINKTDGIGKD
jgi:hypothetical protein